ncbi:tRNA (5-methylaminomethyl-2-thiouridine)(34)-methyltransferase MnmD [Phaeovulum vinaykumarii]|uniref:tRNA U34 5-methylaminomethyl-2-thiouridine-forming methyltransferase MnmC n=1 Tax=Phaeovulum vinaykumarii TaxID=407234 RepID=A0A1N7JSJ1_9RHOB|nr:tRNA (5-methylaminomethyl-2-thiouridine)(34)-methyltransferase MnmD [Phaeovulum vinaykumarii]SIS52297.1 tRNA U34 5-methylaminomethyl-2-thiouridine-forming methyltransferase MnmC [Phaeovulum vinaykumarii]SOB91166.1 tRNA U34 5-methylaminomethyl-2-thiouridine-forming methyltransferase MnmC [Phaeovulum vinaykumarii]
MSRADQSAETPPCATAESPRDPAVADLDWRGALPVSTRFEDPYFSLDNGLAETRHVFLAGNDLPARLAPGFQVAELGFGTGLNMLALALATPADARPVRFTSFEAFPMRAADIARALTAFPEARAIADPFLAAWDTPLPDDGIRRFDLGALAVEVILGDARATLPRWPGRADAWFLDGFAPAKNPELWAPDLMAEVARHTAPRGSFATYTAAGAVRRALAEAGFAVERIPGFGRKRHMSRGRLTAAPAHGMPPA